MNLYASKTCLYTLSMYVCVIRDGVVPTMSHVSSMFTTARNRLLIVFLLDRLSINITQ